MLAKVALADWDGKTLLVGADGVGELLEGCDGLLVGAAAWLDGTWDPHPANATSPAAAIVISIAFSMICCLLIGALGRERNA
ncbi:hypothetical protein [Sulfobacillus harzensis]|uniref:Uncharacterized protein n=1 Tax=Sulfobacillus harzensis TaxID=2729629 RepID=A0A7Y0L5U6_9FIRM|nr:hypothetical protein [Sulfobacillus harzensis]NMP23291.1 hypothetical protein [Sulfobacillus harzensis]